MMFHYEDCQGSIDICWEEGRVVSLKRGGAVLSSEAKWPLFSFRLRMPSCEAVECTAFDGQLAALEMDEKSAKATYRFAALKDSEAVLSVVFGGENWMMWRFAFVNRTEGAVEWADYPQIALRREADGRKASFYWPYNEGVQIDDIDLREVSHWAYREPEYPGQGLYTLFPGMVESQFVAYELAGGLCLAAHDASRGLKNIDCVPLDGCVRLKMRIYAGGEFGKDYRADFEVAGDLFEGGWTAAAELYRRWNDRHLPEGLKKITENDKLPEWYSDSPVIVTYPVRGLHDTDVMEPNRLFPYENALPIIDELAEKMHCRIMVLLMHWEGTAPWAPPFVWPPFGGEEMLKGFIDKLHGRNHLLGVYLSGLGWTEQSNLIAEYNCETRLDEMGLRGELCLSPEGDLPYSKICTAQRRGYDFCPTSEKAAEIVANEAVSMAGAGIDYAQILDQNHGGNAYFCYSREHGHAPVPGPWMTGAMTALLKKVHAAAPGMLFGCESAAGEPFLPHLLFSDNRFNLGWYYGKPVPIFAYLYHEYLNNFMGNQVCAADTFCPHRDSLCYRLAYSFAAGDLPTLILTDDGRIMQAWGDRQFDLLPDRENVLALVGRLTALRRGEGKKYLHEGRMLPALPVENGGTRVFPMNFPARELTVDCVLASRWQAQDGEIRQLLVNWTEEDIRCTVGGRDVLVPALDGVLI